MSTLDEQAAKYLQLSKRVVAINGMPPWLAELADEISAELGTDAPVVQRDRGKPVPHLVIFNALGDVVEIRELPPNLSQEQRTRLLRESVADVLSVPVERCGVAVACDGCRLTVKLDRRRPKLPRGWTERDNGEYCPGCSN